MRQLDKISKAIKQYIEVKKSFRELQISKTERQLVSEIGEWFVQQIYGGERTQSAIQSDWDLKIGDQNIQVKTHAKSDKNKTRWTKIDYPESADIKELIIIVFTEELELKEFYKAPWNKIQKFINREKVKPIIKWNDLKEYRIDHNELPNQKIVKLFK